MPGFGGFISSTGKVPPRKSTVDFYTPINQPITDNAVVYELLKRSEAATEEVGQPYTINTFDLGVVMKACPIVWKLIQDGSTLGCMCVCLSVCLSFGFFASTSDLS